MIAPCGATAGYRSVALSCSWPFGSTSASNRPCALEYAPVPPTITPEKLGGAARPRGGRHSASERSAVGELLAAASHDGA